MAKSMISAAERTIRRNNPLGRSTVALVALTGVVGVGGYFIWRHMTDIPIVAGTITTKAGTRRLVLPSGAKWAASAGVTAGGGAQLAINTTNVNSPITQAFTAGQVLAVAWVDAAGVPQATTITATA